jgi:CubicO group peptidase (beta-lactamase class C family)
MFGATAVVRLPLHVRKMKKPALPFERNCRLTKNFNFFKISDFLKYLFLRELKQSEKQKIMNVKNLFKLLFLLVILFGSTQCKKNNSDLLYNKSYTDEIKEAREKLVLFLRTNFVPGGTFAIAKDGEIIYSEGIGLASKDLEVPVTRNTKFRIGELSELFTNLIYHRMVKEGLLHPDSTIQNYYSAFPEKQYPLSLHHLVQQTSGLRAPNINERDQTAFNLSLQRGIESFSNDSLAAKPGWYQAPNMFNYNLLGAAMEKVSGKRFNELLKTYVTDTLHLSNTLVDNLFATIKGRTGFYDHNYISQVVNATSKDLRFRAPSQGILSNAEDLVKYGNAMLFSDYFTEIINDDFFESIPLYNNIPSQMANGWMLMTDTSGRTIYGKSGTVTGGTAAILVYPDEKLVVAAAVNLTGVTNQLPVFEMAQPFLKEPEAGGQNSGEAVKEQTSPDSTSQK